ncbi:unnamed protein product [Ceutorhynchus assimilis]|uniref:ENTH domain-containing protein n=1 Tax=Ceutorhynchus assimilis TaxID=467358 RepID=A0A9N9MFK3_9CUCU|nr:unnamed protein product [Ceutorhynchus assimilis]
MESLFSMWKVREIADKVTNVVMNYTEIEAKVREATNDEAWGPTGALMQELAHATFTYEHFPEVMSMLWKRMLQDSKQHWRRTYKALLVLNYLIKNGSERVVTSSREHIYDLRSLENFTAIDENGKDQGVNIRHKVKELIDFIQDDDRLREERKKAKKNKDKYVGMSSDMAGMKFGSTSERWDDRQYSKNDFADNSWDDNSNNKYRDKSIEEDVENVDSDDDSPPRGRSNSANRYKDEGRPGSPPVPATTYPDKKVNLNFNANITASPKKIQKPLIKVDLGAAANFGRDSTQSPLPRPPSRGSSADLFDDFNPRAGEKSESIRNEFGSFEAAFNSPAEPSSKVADDFADFSSAFSGTKLPQSNLLISSSTSTVLPNIIAPIPNQTNLLVASPNLLEGPPMPSSGNLMGEFAQAPTATSQLPFISATQPAIFSNQLQSSPPKKSENDLLGDLTDFGSLSLQPAKPAENGNGNINNNLNDGLTGGVLGLLDNFNDTLTTKEGNSKITVQKSLEESTVATIDKITKIGKISSQEDIEKILQYLDDVLKNYPQKLNIQKLQGSEDISYKYLAEHSFSSLIEVIVNLFDDNFPFQDGKIYESVKNIFSIEDPNFFEAILEVLLKNIKNKKNTQSTNVAGCLQILFESDALFADIIANCYLTNITAFDDIISADNWSHMVNTIISLPTRIAKRLERNAPILLCNKQFSNLLLYNMLEAIEFLASEVYANSKAQNIIHFERLAKFLSNIIIHFNETTNCDGIIDFVNILALITNKPSQKLDLYQGILHRVFEVLDGIAVEILVKICLTRLDPKKYLITNILSKKLLNNPNWHYILCTKLPFTEYIETNHENLVTNLTLYLAKASHTELVKFLLKLVSVWANKSSKKRTSVEHQLLICKFIVCVVNCLKELGLPDYEKLKIKKIVYGGLQMHLEMSMEAIRYSGMRIREILTKLLQDDTENQLVFDYDKTSTETKAIITQLDYFLNLDLVELYKQKSDFNDIDIGTFISKLRNKSEDVQYIPPERKFRLKLQQELHNEIVIAEYVKPKHEIIIIDKTLELDSDDEFEPFETDNEKVLSIRQPPAYLRDLVTILVEENSDVDSFTLCLENCEKLVIQQLPNDDASIGLEILKILIALDMKFYVENFDNLVFKSCVAITCVYPAVYANYLCQEIHAEAGNYSLRQKILMLDILGQASRSLSNLTKPVDEDGDEIKRNNKGKVNSHQEIIKKRLENNTRYFHKAVKYELRNKFADVAGHFFFPLTRGRNEQEILSGVDLNFLLHFIDTLTGIVFCAENCPIAPKMAEEAFYLTIFLRNHEDVRVRIAILHFIATVVSTVPESILLNNSPNELFELRLWLPDLAKGEPNTECRKLASSLLDFVDRILKIGLE